MPDLVDEIFGDETPEVEEFYPGSVRKRREVEREMDEDDWRQDCYIKRLHGEEVRMYTVRAFAQALGVSVPTIRSWTVKGYLPQAPYRLPSNMIIKGEKAAGRRLYTESVIDATINILGHYGLLGQDRILWKDNPKVPIAIVEAWTKIIGTEAQGAV